MAEILLLCIAVSSVLNTVLIIKMFTKNANTNPDEVISLYEVQIKNLKRINRLNEKHIKQLKEGMKNDETNMVQTEEQRRVY